MQTAELMKKVRRLEIRTRRLVNDSFAGNYQSVFKGLGMEFEEVRPYNPGDEVRTIDWNVTARMGQPYVKHFVEERELSLMLLVDASASGNFGTTGSFKRELAAELAAVLSFSAASNNDKVGLLIFTDQIELYVPPLKGRRHVLRLIREMLIFEPQSKGTDIRLALDTTNRILKRHSIVFLISDFLSDPQSWSRQMFMCNRKHDLIAIDLQDKLEEQIPQVGLLTLEDPESGKLLQVDTSSSKWQTAFRAERETLEENKKNVFTKSAVDSIRIHTGEDYTTALTRFFEKRSGRLQRGINK